MSKDEETLKSASSNNRADVAPETPAAKTPAAKTPVAETPSAKTQEPHERVAAERMAAESEGRAGVDSRSSEDEPHQQVSGADCEDSGAGSSRASTSGPSSASLVRAPESAPQPQEPRGQRHQFRSRHQQRARAPTDQQQQVPPVSAEYLAQLIKDRKQLGLLPAVFLHVQRLLDDEIGKVRQSLFQVADAAHAAAPLELPAPAGEFVQLQEKLYVPVGEHPEFNFVGRLLGPRGMTAKQLEQDTGCKIMIRGKGSMRDKKKEEQNRGKPNWEHLSDELHVLISVEDTQNRAQLKMQRALEEVRQLLVPIVDGEDELKKRQLMELAIINGTYRDCNSDNEALGKMLADAAYRGAGGPTGGARLDLTPSPGPQAPLNGGRRFAAAHYYANGSSGADTPSPVHGPGHLPQPQPHHQKQHPAPPTYHAQPHHHPHHNPAGPQLSPSASAAALAAVAAVAAAQAHHAPLHHHPHPHHAHHQMGEHPIHAHQQSAGGGALMGPPADASAMIYAQHYHDFHHQYAVLAAAAAASQHQQPPPPMLTAAGYAAAAAAAAAAAHAHHGGPPPPPSAAAMAQAMAAAAAANQQHAYQQQVELDPSASMVYHQQQQDVAAAQQQQQQDSGCPDKSNGNDPSQAERDSELAPQLASGQQHVMT